MIALMLVTVPVVAILTVLMVAYGDHLAEALRRG